MRFLNKIFVMMLGLALLPAAVFALEPVKYLDYDATTKTFAEKTCTDYVVVTADTATFEDGKWYVVNSEVSRGTITVNGAARLILCDNGILNVTGEAYYSAGIAIGANQSLTVYGQSACTGKLNAGAESFAAGIGVYADDATGDTCGRLTINGGVITATGERNSAGIGGDVKNYMGIVTINGGKINATGGDCGAGIGSGAFVKFGIVNINGGFIKASGGDEADDIGSGYESRNISVSITGGKFGLNVKREWLSDGCEIFPNYEEQSAAEYPFEVFLAHFINVGSLDSLIVSWTGGDRSVTNIVSEARFPIPDDTQNLEVIFKVRPGFAMEGESVCTLGSLTQDVDLVELGKVPTTRSAPVEYVDEKGQKQFCENFKILKKGTYTLEDGCWYILNSNIDTYGPIIAKSDVKLILCDDFTMTIRDSSYKAGVEVWGALKIYGQEKGTGCLSAAGGHNSAGICVSYNQHSDLSINGGIVIAKGGNAAAGIGGATDYNCGKVTINGGVVTAIGKLTGAGIGGSHYGRGGEVIITGGKVYAESGSADSADSIGGALGGSAGSSVKISGGMIKVSRLGGAIDVIGGVFSDSFDPNWCSKRCSVYDNPDPQTNADYPYAVGCKITIDKISNAIVAWTGADGSVTNTVNDTNFYVPADTENVKLIVTAFEGFFLEGNSVGADGVATVELGTITSNLKVEKSKLPIVKLRPEYPITYVDENGVLQTCGDYIFVTETTDEFTDEWYVTKGDISRGSIKVKGDAKLILADGAKLTVQGADNEAGLEVPEGSSITIYGQVFGSGELNAYGGFDGAGIGGGKKQITGFITILGGKITALGGPDGAGIGGGFEGSCGTITIKGTAEIVKAKGAIAAGIGCGACFPHGNGNKTDGEITISGKAKIVEAKGGEYSAGIGGSYCNEGIIKIVIEEDAEVIAIGGDSGAGIGGSYKNDGGTITIKGGTITAKGGRYAAGIGGGESGAGGAITISGKAKIVEAKGGINGAGIGGGDQGNGGVITLNGGVVEANGGANVEGGAGIGGGHKASSGTILIRGGIITAWAYGFSSASGIGGGYQSGCDEIRISGGAIKAVGGDGALGTADDIGVGSGGMDKEGLEISGGIFARDLKDEWLKAGYKAVENTDDATKETYKWAIVSSIPSDYTRVKYIKALNGSYIDTGYKPNQNTRVVMDVKVYSGDEFWFGCWNESSAGKDNEFMLCNNATQDDALYVGYGKTTNKTHTVISPGRHKIELDRGNVKVDSHSILIIGNTTAFSVTNNLYMLSRQNRKGTAFMRGYCTDVVCYGARISEITTVNSKTVETMKRNFIPCKRNSDGRYGFYDTVEGKFYLNAGTKFFTGTSVLEESPRKYTILKSITAPSGVYIDTGYKPIPSTHTWMDLKTDTLKAYWFGATTGSASNTFGHPAYCVYCHGLTTPETVDVHYGNDGKQFNQIKAGTRYKFEVDNEFYSSNGTGNIRLNGALNGTTLSKWNATSVLGSNMYIFGLNVNGTFMCLDNQQITCYGFSIGERIDTNSETVKHRFLPCKRNSDGVCGLFDTVSEKFYTYTKSASGVITGGEEEPELNKDDESDDPVDPEPEPQEPEKVPSAIVSRLGPEDTSDPLGNTIEEAFNYAMTHGDDNEIKFAASLFKDSTSITCQVEKVMSLTDAGSKVVLKTPPGYEIKLVPYLNYKVNEYYGTTVLVNPPSRCFVVKNGATLVLDGLEITDNNGEGFLGVSLTGLNTNGGAIGCEGALVVTNCTFKNSLAGPRAKITYSPTGQGGAIAAVGTGANVTIVNSRFENNQAENGGAVASLNGGTMNVYNSTFKNNKAYKSFPLGQSYGASAYKDVGSTLALHGCEFEGNSCWDVNERKEIEDTSESLIAAIQRLGVNWYDLESVGGGKLKMALNKNATPEIAAESEADFEGEVVTLVVDNVKPGLKYALGYTDTLAGEFVADNWVVATSDEPLVVSAPKGDSSSRFFRILVSD